jgi:hypothetical protein
MGLDTAYDDHDLDMEQLTWIRAMLDRAGGRRVLFFSHQQLVSHFAGQGDLLLERLGPILTDARVAVWYWGHEHRAIVYDPDPRFGGFLGRCLGHSGMPEHRGQYRGLPVAHAHPGAQWRRFPGKDGAPGGEVMDGENPYIRGSEQDYSPHGYGLLELSGEHLAETFCLPDGEVVYHGEPF